MLAVQIRRWKGFNKSFTAIHPTPKFNWSNNTYELRALLVSQNERHYMLQCKGNNNSSFYLMQCHQGSTLNSGHYYAVVRTSTGQWYKCDDVIVTPISMLSSGIHSDLYVAFYKKVPAGKSRQCWAYTGGKHFMLP